MQGGGSVKSVYISQIDVGARTFSVASDYKLPHTKAGYNNTFEMNGDGTGRPVKIRSAFKLDGIMLSFDSDLGDDDFLQDVADSIGSVTLSVNLVDDSVITFIGTITGPIVADRGNGTVPITFEGARRATTG